MSKRSGSVFGGTLLVAGTCVGAAVLALPVLTAAAGFLPSVVICFLSWIVMASSGLLFLEIALWMEPDTNIVSMSGAILGRWGKGVAWVIYLYLFYSLTAAYTAGGGGLIAQWSGGTLPAWLGSLLIILFFGPFVWAGTRAVDRINEWLVGGLILCFLAFVVVGIPLVRVEHLKVEHWGAAFTSLPVVFTSFGYQGIVPSLTEYLGRDPIKVRRAILLGTMIPFVAYLIWDWLIMGIIPLEGPQGLRVAQAAGQTAVAPLRYLLDSPAIYWLGQGFAFFALTSSFLGVTLGLRDFLADGFGVRKGSWQRLGLCFLIYLPAFIITLVYPTLFIVALNYGGAIGCALLLVLLPVILVLVGRYRQEKRGPYRWHGGVAALLLLALFIVVELAADFL